MKFNTGKCPKCGYNKKLMFQNNPIGGTPICFDCIKENLNSTNLEHADFFCRTYNLPFQPELWVELEKIHHQEVFEQYAQAVLEDPNNQPNLAYSSSTHDLWNRTNKEWEKTRSFMEVLNKISSIKDSYVMRGRLKWGEQYTFEDIIKLDSIYTRTLKANNITSPLQKEAVKSLCKLHVEMDEALRAKDAKALKDFSTTYQAFAKAANLEEMINETQTDDITTVAELYDYMEKQGFQFKFYDGFDRDEVDRTIKDIQDANRRLILESTGLQPILEDMINQRKRTIEEEHAAKIAQEQSLSELLEFQSEGEEIDTEDDSEALNVDFTEDPDAIERDELAIKTIKRQGE